MSQSETACTSTVTLTAEEPVASQSLPSSPTKEATDPQVEMEDSGQFTTADSTSWNDQR